jgi:perosamine synthetase
VVTGDKEIAARAASYRNLCFQPERRFYHTELGYNFRMTNLQAAIALAQLEKIDQHVEIKRRNAAAYTARLKDIACLKLPVEKDRVKNVYWMYGIELRDDARMDNQEFARKLREKGVDTRPFFIGMHEQPVFHRMGLFKNESYPVAEKLARRGLYLPSGLALREEQIESVSQALHDILGE